MNCFSKIVSFDVDVQKGFILLCLDELLVFGGDVIGVVFN